jgi:hypothetical protein
MTNYQYLPNLSGLHAFYFDPVPALVAERFPCKRRDQSLRRKSKLVGRWKVRAAAHVAPSLMWQLSLMAVIVLKS